MCSRERPCLGVLRQILLASTFRVDACGSGHEFRTETPWAGGFRMAREAHDPTRCQYCLDALPPHHGPGRRPHYCSDRCRYLAR